MEQHHPGAVLLGVNSMSGGLDGDGSSSKRITNLLELLRPAKIEPVIVAATRRLISHDLVQARIIATSIGVLARFASRRQLISPGELAATEAKLGALVKIIDG